MKSTILILAALFVFAGFAFGEDAAPVVAEAGKYPLTVCPSCGDPNPGMDKSFSKVYNGREVIFCCEDCSVPFEKNLPESMSALNVRIADAQAAKYPLTTCVVCGETLGPEGKYVEAVHLNRYLRFCCKECLTSFDKNPSFYTGNLNVAPGTPAPQGN